MAESSIVELNVGGVFYTTATETLTKNADSTLAEMFSSSKGKEATATVVKDAKGKYFLDRDGVLFRYVLDYLRNGRLVLPENFHEKDRLKCEAVYYGLPDMVKNIEEGGSKSKHLSTSNGGEKTSEFTVMSTKEPSCILLGYRGTFAFGRDGLADVKFRKLSRILVHGRVNVCREVFGDTLNESRDPDRGSSDRYTSRFFLKHTFIEQAFDMLVSNGFTLSGSVGSGTNSAGDLKPGMDSEESRWNHYNEFIFVRT